MRVRICGFNDQFWCETKTFWAWKRLPSIDHWLLFREMRFDVRYTKYFHEYESAHEMALEYLKRFGKGVAVFTEVHR